MVLLLGRRRKITRSFDFYLWGYVENDLFEYYPPEDCKEVEESVKIVLYIISDTSAIVLNYNCLFMTVLLIFLL